MVKFITASHDYKIYERNLLASKVFSVSGPELMEGFRNIPHAYNSAVCIGLRCYVHHDVFLPDDFISRLVAGITNAPEDWGVLGVAGVRLIDGKKVNIGNILDRGREWGSPLNEATEVDTLDELLLITKGNFKFDERFPFDFYGADICMQAKAAGFKNYAIPAYVHHNSSRAFGGRTPEFYQAEKEFKIKWKDYMPIATTCSIMTHV